MTQLELIDEIEKIEVRDMTSEEEEDHRSRQETNLRIYAKKGVDVREKVFVQMAECQIPVLEMHTVTRSLEDVFLEITQEGEKK